MTQTISKPSIWEFSQATSPINLQFPQGKDTRQERNDLEVENDLLKISIDGLELQVMSLESELEKLRTGNTKRKRSANPAE